MNNRIIYSKNGVLEDFSTALNSYHTGTKTLTFTAIDDAIYISSRLPLNHIYIKASKFNLDDVNMKVSYHSGNYWSDTVELIDSTNGLKESGFIQFTPNRNKSWAMVTDTSTVTELAGITIYDQYWIKIEFDADLTEVTLDWIGNLFSDDSDLGIEFPDLIRSNTLTSFKTGKTNWQEQHVKAASIIIGDLVNKGVIKGVGQILDWRDFTNASVSKVSEIIFTAFGDDYVDNVISSRREYSDRLSKRLNRVDQNNNAIEDKEEFGTSSVGYFTR